MLLMELSPSLRNDIVSFTYSKVISKLRCLHTLERVVVTDLVSRMRPLFAVSCFLLFSLRGFMCIDVPTLCVGGVAAAS